MDHPNQTILSVEDPLEGSVILHLLVERRPNNRKLLILFARCRKTVCPQPT